MNFPTKRRALIAGASSVIGKATALAFAKAGIDVALVSRCQKKLEAVAEAARLCGVKAGVYPLDLANISSVRERIAAIAAEENPIDILVNSAGMGYTGTLMDTPLADYERLIDLNLTSVFQCVQGVLPAMRARRSGLIVNVASIAGKQTFPNWGAYAVSKFGVMALSKTLAEEERPHGIRVTAICPGAVNTPLCDAETVGGDFNRSSMLTPEIVAQSILHIALLPETAALEELTLMPSAGTL
ncbi:MAG: SDR family oxidoreductase [Oscillatoria sp. Prado101]|jgi:short-subunit dehydrogenase|nr:SDR family oxidoreductase [Oscillatoria sp. Prado101]